MLDVLASPPSDATLQGDARWHSLIDELLTGDCSEEEFVSRVCGEQADTPDAAWSAVAILDQRFRRGQVSADLYRSIGAKITRHELRHSGDGNTVNQRTHRWRRLLAQQPVPTQTTPHAHGHAGLSIIEQRPVPRVIEAGRVLRDRYELEGRLGIGGMGTVYKALDRFRADLREDGRHVAIKILHQTQDADDVVRLRREFFCAQALSHPHIVKVYELDRDDNVAFFTMEYLEGRLLDALIGEAQPGAVPRTVAWTVIRDVGSALAYAHSRHVVHGDLKPQNIMITGDGDVRILDFGASSDPARLTRSIGTAEASISEFTPAYACREILDGMPADPADDLYALACLSYELLTGNHPFGGRNATEARELGLAPARPATLTARQWAALRMGLACDRQDRSVSVADWVNEMMREVPSGQRIVDESAPLESTPAGDIGPPTEAGVAAEDAAVSSGAAPGPDGGISLADFKAATDAPLGIDTSQEKLEGKPEASMSSVRPARVELPTPAAKFPDSEAPVMVIPPQPSSRSSRMPNSTLLIAVLVCATIWAAASHPWSEARLASDQVPSRIQVLAETAPLVVAVDPQTPAALDFAQGPSDMGEADQRRAIASSAGLAPKRLRFSAESYRIRRGQGFAELHIIRPPGLDGDEDFVWWTEAGSARPGVDYIAQKPAAQFLTKSQRRASLFIKIPSGAQRGTRTTFFVAATDPRGRSISGIARALVTIPPG